MSKVIGINALIFLDENGNRFFAKYYDECQAKKQGSELLKYEKNMFDHFTQIIEEMKDTSEGKVESRQPRYSTSRRRLSW